MVRPWSLHLVLFVECRLFNSLRATNREWTPVLIIHSPNAILCPPSPWFSSKTPHPSRPAGILRNEGVWLLKNRTSGHRGHGGWSWAAAVHVSLGTDALVGQGPVVCPWYMFNSQLLGETEPWPAVFASVDGMNTTAVVDFKLPLAHQPTYTCPENLAIGSHELVQAYYGTRICYHSSRTPANVVI